MVAQWARSAEIPIIHSDSNHLLEAAVGPARLDWLFSVANLRPVSADVLKLAANGGVNFHDGPLPRYGGMHAPAWAVMAGERVHGVTWHRMAERLDAGAILMQRLVPIDDDETSLTLNLKCFEAGAESFDQLLALLPTLPATATTRELDRQTYHLKSDRVPAAATLDWTRGARELSAIVRALDFGAYRNPLGAAKVVLGETLVIARAARALAAESSTAPGTVVGVDDTGIVVATTQGDLRLESFASLDGAPLTIDRAVASGAVVVGKRLPPVGASVRDRLSVIDRAVASHEQFWIQRFHGQDPLELPLFVRRDPPAAPTRDRHSWQWIAAASDALPRVDGLSPTDVGLAAACVWLAHISQRESFDVALSIESLGHDVGDVEPWVVDAVPFHVALASVDFATFAISLREEIGDLKTRGAPLRDLTARAPTLRGTARRSPVGLVIGEHASSAPRMDCQLAFAIDFTGRIRIGFHANVVDAAIVESFGRHLTALFASCNEGATVDQVSLLDDATRRSLDDALRGDVAPLDPDATICSMFAAQVARTPDATALIAAAKRLSYRQLDEASLALARRLRALGVRLDVRVGVCLSRGPDLLVGVLGILRAGGAYVPLDPTYPVERLRYMIRDSAAPVIVTSVALAAKIPAGSASVVTIDRGEAESVHSQNADRAPAIGPHPTSLAYVIYTSGSTGTPKGVMVEHRNVTSFFAAMDRLLGTDPVKWLAITSLAFDISVLELLWPLMHGSTVVIRAAPDSPESTVARLAFSLFYFSAEARQGGDKYRLLLEGARFADRRGFSAVWTPERHFHAFGGIFPNPSVTSAAIAAITERVAIRAGSVVLPLHHPLRIAEEWSVVDNLSNGRVGVSFASGWRPEDFVLRPEAYKDAKTKLIEGIETIRRLWRGESITFDGPGDKAVDVTIHPRPVQPELPVFITSAGSPDTFEAAGRSGAGVLTHLLGQSLDELREKIAVYRSARAAAGHAGTGSVVLMLHAFVGEDDDTVKELVREPMKTYLRTSVSLIEKNAHAFPAFKKRTDGVAHALDFASLGPEDVDALLDFSFERYFETSALFGSVARCQAMAESLESIGVSEVACLIDFGVDPELVLRHLEFLDDVRVRIQDTASATIGDLLAHHDITHLQCTPSQAALLLTDAHAREHVRRLEVLLVGGEALPTVVAASLRQLGARRLLNMYGPTETTVWSTSHDVRAVEGPIPIGRPIANTWVRVAGWGGTMVPHGVPGELWIGGPGVSRGYLDRQVLTEERFVVPDDEAGRVYRTGDRVRLDLNGDLIFLGRTDGQVKVRGYRIELGEIERQLTVHPAVAEAVVVVAGEQPDDRRLIGYVVLRQALPNATTALREGLRGSLPDFMIPSRVIVLEEFPRTLNGKIDRTRLLSGDGSSAGISQARASALPSQPSVVAPSASAKSPRKMSGSASDLMLAIAAIWSDVLRTGNVGVDDNFFELGGHSLLAVQVHRRVKEAIGRDLPITDLFRYPTVRSLASHLGTDGQSDDSAAEGVDRAVVRKQALQRRRSAPDR